MATTALPLRGDEDQLFRRYNDRLLRAVARFAHAPDAVIEDACAFAWVQLLRHQPDRCTAFAWLRRVAIREAWRLSRRETRDAHLEDLHPEVVEANTARDLDRILEAREALTVLAELPERQARYLSLLVAGYRYDEIVDIAGTTYTNVNKHLVRARASVRRLRNR